MAFFATKKGVFCNRADACHNQAFLATAFTQRGTAEEADAM